MFVVTRVLFSILINIVRSFQHIVFFDINVSLKKGYCLEIKLSNTILLTILNNMATVTMLEISLSFFFSR